MGSQLPEMSSPPVSEVVCGVRFAALPLDPIDFGAMWQERRDEYPEKRLLPALSEAGTVTVGLLPPARAWMISSDDTIVVQVQSDRFYVNWRAREEAYPRFHNILPRLQQEFDSFVAFCEARVGTAPAVDRVELAKINILREGQHWNGGQDLTKVLPVLESVSALAQSEPPNVMLQLAEDINGGERTCNIATGQETPPTGPRVMKVENRVVAKAVRADMASRFDAANQALNDLFARLIPREEMVKRFGGKS